MQTITSKDGTPIAYDRQGTGPALILIDGALCTREANAKTVLVNLLAPYFTVYWYDRRGRGDSGDTPPSSVVREIEDIAALIAVAGGTAALYGHSSGAALGFNAAEMLGNSVTKLAMYEVPYSDAPAARDRWPHYSHELKALLAADRRGDAVALFMTEVGLPAEQIATMRQAPWWSSLEALAPTLAYDQAAISDTDGAVPVERASRLTIPTLVMNGGAGDPFMAETARTLSTALPQGQHRVLEGQTHEVRSEVLAPVLVEFFSA